MAAKEQSTPKGRTKTTPRNYPPAVVEDALFDRVVGILEQARSNVVRAVNGQMVLAYWLIGREIAQEIQGGKKRADYGRQVLADLSRKLAERYGAGFSETSLRYFRSFHLAYANRFMGIQRPVGAESSREGIQHPLGAELAVPEQGRTPRDLSNAPDPTSAIQHTMCAESLPPSLICYPAGSESLFGFAPQLSWSHYRALMRVEKPEARDFYEREAADGSFVCCLAPDAAGLRPPASHHSQRTTADPAAIIVAVAAARK